MKQNLAEAITRIDQLQNRVEKLEKAVFGGRMPKKTKGKKRISPTGHIDFSLNERAFVKRYASNKSGPRKFTTLLAHLARGEVGKDIKYSAIEESWNRMTSLLGQFNPFYSSQSKNQGWVDSKERGSYRLTKEWKNAL